MNCDFCCSTPPTLRQKLSAHYLKTKIFTATFVQHMRRPVICNSSQTFKQICVNNERIQQNLQPHERRTSLYASEHISWLETFNLRMKTWRCSIKNFFHPLILQQPLRPVQLNRLMCDWTWKNFFNIVWWLHEKEASLKRKREGEREKAVKKNPNLLSYLKPQHFPFLRSLFSCSCACREWKSSQVEKPQNWF